MSSSQATNRKFPVRIFRVNKTKKLFLNTVKTGNNGGLLKCVSTVALKAKEKGSERNNLIKPKFEDTSMNE